VFTANLQGNFVWEYSLFFPLLHPELQRGFGSWNFCSDCSELHVLVVAWESILREGMDFANKPKQQQ
jgi:hypothetical protein